MGRWTRIILIGRKETATPGMEPIRAQAAVMSISIRLHKVDGFYRCKVTVFFLLVQEEPQFYCIKSKSPVGIMSKKGYLCPYNCKKRRNL